ncbi:MAG: hypothetical protein QOJ94_634 [Sphingomonadales bacterium]|nr:hypothetical protein [Sphingomonadales bacterium]
MTPFIALLLAAQDMPGMAMPSPPPPPPPAGQKAAEQHDMDGMDMPGMDADPVAERLSRDSDSGTAWQPDLTLHGGPYARAGAWMLMAHARLNAVYDRQSGPRGGEKAFVSGMAMAMASRPLGREGRVELRAMLSPDPLMGARGYPLLLAAGETADGRTLLVDRQHPHDLVGELSARFDLRLGTDAKLFLYAGLPGAPAFGPAAYMHRPAAMDDPEAPISHHWLDSTHVSFGVVTVGAVVGRVKLEASRFNGREPDQHRGDIETGPLDSTALRASWNPVPELSLQASWARQKSPEQLEPGVDVTRWSASAMLTKRAGTGRIYATVAWGRRTAARGRALDALLAELAWARNGWTLFGRAERIESDELQPGSVFTVGKLSVGGVRDFEVAPHAAIGVGASASLSLVPAGLDSTYRGNRLSGILFVRLRID